MYAGAFLIGWLLMTIAMMLPTTVTLTNLFRRMTARHVDAWLLVALLLVGYVAAWLAFGTLALALTWTANRLLPAESTWLWGPGLFLLAGAFQFSSVKYACLDKCRSPFGFLAGRWQGRARRQESFAIGWTHGLFCVGCCWALMMLMFAAGTASLGFMLLLAVIMAAEKNARWGQRMSRPLGYVLLTAGAGWGLYSLI
jgi:predicted metal-binding membrane protein